MSNRRSAWRLAVVLLAALAALFGAGEFDRTALAASPPNRGESPDATPTIYAFLPCHGPFDSRASVSWSADGGQVLYAEGLQVVAVEAYGSRVDFRFNVRDAAARFGSSSEASRNISYASMSPDGTSLVYADCRDDPYSDVGGATALVDTSTNRTRLVAVNGAAPAWSPDGTRIAFVSRWSEEPWASWEEEVYGRVLEPGLYTVAADGSDLRRVGERGDLRRYVGTTLTRIVSLRPAWSPDGTQLAYAQDSDAIVDPPYAVDLYVSALDGSSPQLLVTDAMSGPAWSPDGTRLAFAKPDGEEVALYTIGADGLDTQRVTTIGAAGECWRRRLGEVPGYWITTVAWSPDGSKILYTCPGVVYVVGVDGTPVGRSLLPVDRRQVVVGAWSPDGARIAVGTGWTIPDKEVIDSFYGDTHINLFTMAPDGSDMRILLRTYDGNVQLVGERRPSGRFDATWCGDGAAVPIPAANPGLMRDCMVLLAARDELSGTRWLNWSAERPLGDWEGVVLGGLPLRVVELNLGRPSLRGIIPPGLAGLTQLRVLNLSGHRLGGVIPPELGRLTQLRVLDLSRNAFGGLGGGIPAELGGLAQLRVLRLDGNCLTGPIPPEIGQLANLQDLGLDANQLTGAIPAELGQLDRLQGLSLHDNRLTGPIPAELGQLDRLQGLSLHDNRLTGPIPAELGQLDRLQGLSLHDNRLTGPIPAELGRLDRLQRLYLHRNQLTGEIPAVLGQLANLEILDLAQNQITGPIPPALGQLVKVWDLDLSSNQLTGPIPSALGQMARLRLLDLGKNQITGPIPAALGQLVRLEQLDLSTNQMFGMIPLELGELSELIVVRLGSNRLTGCWPAEASISDRNLVRLPNCKEAP